MAGNKTNVAVLGTGGLGKVAARIIGMKSSMKLAAVCDSKGYAYAENGLDAETVAKLVGTEAVCNIPQYGHTSKDSLGEIIKLADKIDAIFVALPNLPNDFIPNVVKRFVEGGYRGVWSDALKRTPAMEMMFGLDDLLKQAQGVYITGAGATPGLLTAAAVIAAQSFTKVEHVNIWWGVGIPNWEDYKATIREDIAHLPGYNVEKAKAMSDAEIEQLLNSRSGRLELHQMEHADDLLLTRVGVVERRDQVEVGGIIDTRSSKKPVSTTMTLTGYTFEGKKSSHRFILGDETSMGANVVGPALGYLARAVWLKEHKIYGVFGSTEFMPMVVV